MGLNQYRKKRDFQKTPEPRGKDKPPTTRRLYVIQKHAASRLHYDLRLELDGVLKSWAVPKGPSVDPGEKRLAVHVEDHPMDYGTFEGTIPAGEYGGGTVMLWDKGTWTPEGDPDEEYRIGRMHFLIHGEKLQGRWTLFKLGGGKDDNGKNWLLVKSKDAYSDIEDRVLEEKDRSVSTGRTMAEITAGIAHPERFLLKNARKADFPVEISPHLPTLVDSPPKGDQWIHEIKYDGYRIVAFIEKNSARLSSRNNKDWTGRFRTIADALSNFPAENAIIDGEVVIQLPEGITSFQALQNTLQGVKTGTLIYYLFDILYHDGFDLTESPLIERKTLLKQLLDQMAPQPVIRYSDHVEGSGEKVYAHACRLSLEGIVSKDLNSAYRQKRTRNWLKVKCGYRQEFVIGGYSRPSGSRTAFGALLLGVYDDHGNLLYCGRVGTGFSEKQLVSLKQTMTPLERQTPPFADPPKGAEAKNVHWLDPQLVAEISFAGWTQDNSLRHPVFKGLREDKEAGGIRRETTLPENEVEKDMAEATAKPPDGKTPAAGSTNITRINDVRITNPGRILYPEQGVTKTDLANYYVSIAEFILPHVVHRPLSLVRCPRGREGECFYQKHFAEALPDFTRGVQIQEKKSAETYLVIDDVRGLVSLTQIGVLEIHLWNAREDRIERPDLMIMDLDPAPGVNPGKVVEGTALLHDFLNSLGLRNFLKTSGGKGFHVVIPLARRSGWEDMKTFAGAVARQMTRMYPDRFIDTMSKKKREGKIFIDYFRNTRGATSIAPYSTRARPGAPVSAPLAWEELAQTAPDAYRIDNMDQRRSALQQNNPWKDFTNVSQSITLAMKKKVGL
jgi:bifunctional non-homologous end joining protein LigD